MLVGALLLQPEDRLLRVHLVGVVMVILSAEKKGELGIVLLLGLRHGLEFRSISRHELRQLVNNVADVLVGRRSRQLVHGEHERARREIAGILPGSTVLRDGLFALSRCRRLG